jgi:hypothetical protein
MNCSTTPHAVAMSSVSQPHTVGIIHKSSSACMIPARKGSVCYSLRQLRAEQSDAKAKCSGGEERCQQPPGHILDYSVLYTAKQMQF